MSKAHAKATATVIMALAAVTLTASTSSAAPKPELIVIPIEQVAQTYTAPDVPAPELDRGSYSVKKLPPVVTMPVATTAVSSDFGERECNFGPCPTFHKGVDFAMPYGSPINAFADGVVIFADFDADYGNKVVIEHDLDGEHFTTVYAHIRDEGTFVTVGQRVSAGDLIAEVGETGLSYGTHLHFEIRHDGEPVNPQGWIASHKVRPFAG